MGAAPRERQQNDAKVHLYMKTLSYSNGEYTPKVPLILLTVEKIKCENFYCSFFFLPFCSCILYSGKIWLEIHLKFGGSTILPPSKIDQCTVNDIGLRTCTMWSHIANQLTDHILVGVVSRLWQLSLVISARAKGGQRVTVLILHETWLANASAVTVSDNEIKEASTSVKNLQEKKVNGTSWDRPIRSNDHTLEERTSIGKYAAAESGLARAVSHFPPVGSKKLQHTKAVLYLFEVDHKNSNIPL